MSVFDQQVQQLTPITIEMFIFHEIWTILGSYETARLAKSELTCLYCVIDVSY